MRPILILILSALVLSLYARPASAQCDGISRADCQATKVAAEETAVQARADLLRRLQTPTPTATATPQPTDTPTPAPTATATPEPSATATVAPTVAATVEARNVDTQAERGGGLRVGVLGAIMFVVAGAGLLLASTLRRK